ncbi:hypothetical protein F5884DRAFT_852680 [Xylogone sp. PMI_703]|nr:hypothetical protein F5884DRAFT_852680 [Xylogone sp. PMI_703]
MSFGISIGDFVAVTSLAWNIYNSCRDSPGEFKIISDEVESLHIILENSSKHILQYGIDINKETELNRLIAGCHAVLNDIQKLLGRYSKLGAKKRNIWRRIRWAIEDISGVKNRLTSTVTLLTAFNSSLVNSCQARIETKLDQLINITEQPGGITLPPTLIDEDATSKLSPQPANESQIPLQTLRIPEDAEQKQSQSMPIIVESSTPKYLDGSMTPPIQRVDSGIDMSYDEASTGVSGAEPTSPCMGLKPLLINPAQVTANIVKPEQGVKQRITSLSECIINQGGSMYSSNIKSKDVTQGNELQISSPKPFHHEGLSNDISHFSNLQVHINTFFYNNMSQTNHLDRLARDSMKASSIPKPSDITSQKTTTRARLEALLPKRVGVVTQEGSNFKSSVKGISISQGNEAEITSVISEFTQKGSDFEGHVEATASVMQGNRIKF